MNRSINIRQLENGDSMAFDVSIENHSYKVSVGHDYYRKLTGGKITPDALVRKSFEFLLEREGLESILPEFELPLINSYFPEYEATITKLSTD